MVSPPALRVLSVNKFMEQSVIALDINNAKEDGMFLMGDPVSGIDVSRTFLIHLWLLHTVPSPKLRNDCGEFNMAVHIAFLLPLVVFLSSRRRRHDALIEVGIVAFPFQQPIHGESLRRPFIMPPP